MKPTIARTAETVLPTEGQIDRPVESKGRRRESQSERVRGKSLRYARTGPRSDRSLTLEVAAMEYIWLYDSRHGVSIQEIAARAGVSVDRVRFGVGRAKALESKHSMRELSEDLRVRRPDELGFRLIPLFPIGAFTPRSECPHHDTLERGSKLCCMVCHASGMDDHPGLRRDPQTDPSPEPQPAPAAEAAPRESAERKETRKQRRRRRFAEAAVA